MNIESLNDNTPERELINNLKNEQKNILKEIESLKNDMKNLKTLHLSYQQLIQNAFILLKTELKTELKEDIKNQIKEFKNQLISGLNYGGGW